MNDTGVIDRFLEVFSRYIDSGFGLLGGEVAFLATTLIVIDMTLAALFWAWADNDDVIARLVKKTLFIGVFAYIIGNWNSLANIILQSFAGLGLQASGGTMTAADLLRPGRIAEVGLDAGRPLLDAIGELMGFVSFFENFLQIAILLLAWLLVLLSFFILAIQLFVTIIEFKLTTLAGFVLIPFGLFGKTAFLAERVLGNVVSSGIKVLVLAVIVGIGSTLFAEFTAGFAGAPPTLEDAAAIMLGALSMLGLGIFGPGIANGIVSGGPQLGAGAAVGTGLAAGGMVAAGVGAARMAAGAATDLTKGAVAGATQLPASRAGDAAPASSSATGGAAGGGASSPPTPPPAPYSPSGGGGATLPAKDGVVSEAAANGGAVADAGTEVAAATASETSVAEPAGAEPVQAEAKSGVIAETVPPNQTGAASATGEATEQAPAAQAAPTAAATNEADAPIGEATTTEPAAVSSSSDAPAQDKAESTDAAAASIPVSDGSASDLAEPPPAVERPLAGNPAATEFAANISDDTASKSEPAPDTAEPAWAKSMRNRMAISRGVSAATHTLRSGDSRGPGASIDLKE